MRERDGAGTAEQAPPEYAAGPGGLAPAEGAPRWARPAWVRLIVMLVLFVLVEGIVSAINSALDGNAVAGLLLGLVCAGLVLWGYAKAVGLLEHRQVAELARDGAARSVWRGTLAGLGLFAVTIGVIAMFGGYGIAGWGSFGAFVACLGLMCAVAAVEEVLLRGVLFRIVEEMTGTWGALAVSALVFGVLHLVNAKATVWGALAIAMEAGLMLGAAYAATRTLWLPIGLHLGWNFAEGGIFGVTVSGNGDGPAGLLKGTLSGPVALTGGGFGPEASVVAILVCGVPTVLLLRRARRDGRIRPRRRRATAGR
ncbi:type II CAAX endopeptidase family protein [Actinoallomurus oryzae]|uniref:Type II CAAX endopeptidase family protein n=1 Tax=Actinoallomurus oryzae TaxID=502180 RepID=A0ABP8PM99_9ACTN